MVGSADTALATETRTRLRAAAGPALLARTRRWCDLLRWFARTKPLGAACGAILLMMTLLAVLAPWISPYDPLEAHLQAIRSAPSAAYPLGTDYNGRDVLSRIIHGGRISLTVGFIAVLLGTGIGAVWGLVSGFFGGNFDLLSQRLLEVILSFPSLVLAMIFMAAFGASLGGVIVAISITRVPYATRVIRAVVLSLRETAYVEAARALGCPTSRILLRHVAPNCLAPFLIVATAHLGVAILIEASLSFLGAGVPPPAPTWGQMLGGVAAESVRPLWWLVVFPGLAITVTVLALNLFGDALRDVLDPKLKGSEVRAS
jgi:peptide/nickel transport system permease protein